MIPLVATLIVTQTATAPAPDLSKTEVMVPMRDGVRLKTVVYSPKRVGSFPILMVRTPYGAGPYGEGTVRANVSPGPEFDQAGYIYVYQDVRGKYLSEGTFVDVRPELGKGVDESTDTYDTVDWLVKHVPANNGRVGIWGISYPGFYAAAGTIDSHPALKAASPQAPVSNWFLGDDFHHNGAFFLQDAFNFYRGFGQPRPMPTATPAKAPDLDRGAGGEYGFFLRTGALPNFRPFMPGGFWDDLMTHGTYDAWWKARANPDHLRNAHCAILTVGGFYDAEDLWGALHTYAASERKNPGTPNFLVMGPWFHGAWARSPGRSLGGVDFGSDTSDWFRQNVLFPFWERYLRGGGAGKDPAEATVFETGTNRWRTFGQWPPKAARTASLYFGDGRTLADQEGRSGEDAYTYDPANPTPYLADYGTSTRRTREYMTDDQRFASSRSDVLSFQTPPLTGDRTVAGPIDADLWVTTTGTDADFVVKLIDVWPDDAKEMGPTGESMAGYQQLVRGEVMRGKFRGSFAKPVPFVPGRPTRVRFRLPDAMHTFRPGHRIMVQVQSAWFPLVDRNPNIFTDIYHAKDADFHPATILLLHGPKTPSSIRFAELERTKD